MCALDDNSYFKDDIERIFAKRYDHGADLWTTPDKRIAKGSPFSTLGSALMLAELDCKSDKVMHDIAQLIFSCWREDGRFQIAPKSAIYPCHTAGTARILCSMGHASDIRLQKSFQHLFDIQYPDGGWRCNTFKYGRGPETEFSNPGTTLEALEAFRYTEYLNKDKRLDRAVEFLLKHWDIRKPLGPCLYGIGTLFMKVEYPMFRYNLFYYVYTLSFYNYAKKDRRFLEALSVFEAKLQNGQVVIENPNRKLKGFSFCRMGEPSILATKKYKEILENLR